MDTEEDAFWLHLEANPSDSVARLVFADWLQERGDLRAEGMRVLGRLSREAFRTTYGGYSMYPAYGAVYAENCLGDAWWEAFSRWTPEDDWPKTREECESKAALSWLELTQEERDGICKLD